MNNVTYVGMDTHKKIHYMVAIRPGGEIQEERVDNEAGAIRHVMKNILEKAPGEVAVCYEAGVCGYSLARLINGIDARIKCQVIAPSMIPMMNGDRVKTDRKDAKRLAQLHSNGLLREVRQPDEKTEGLRELCRCRDAARLDLARSQQQLGKFLIRHHRIYSDGSNWTGKHEAWLKEQKFSDSLTQYTYGEYRNEVTRRRERLEELDREIERQSEQKPWAESVRKLKCLKGVSTLTAVSLVAEVHGMERFSHAEEFMAWCGLVPSEYSSGGKVQRGGITKTGNRFVRRLLVEASWHYQFRDKKSESLKKRQAGQEQKVIHHADKAQRDLSKCWQRMKKQGKKNQVIAVATARRLAGFIWGLLHPYSAVNQG